MPQNDEENVNTFTRTDIFYNRDVEVLAKHFEGDKNELRVSTQAMDLYRKSVASIRSDDNGFGRRLSILSSSSAESIPIGKESFAAPPAESSAWKFLPSNGVMMSPKFHLFMLHGFFHFTTLYMPFQFLPSQMFNVGLTQKVASRVVSTMAFAGLVGRLVCGFLMDHPKIGVMRAFTLSQLVVGLAIFCFQFCFAEGCSFDSFSERSP